LSKMLLETYISPTAKFRPEMWSAVPCAELKRTTNGPESFHSHFNQQFYSAHPTIFAFVDVILKLQTTTYVKIRSLDLPANTRKNDQEKIDFLLDQYRQYSCGDISRPAICQIHRIQVCPQEQICELSEISFSAIVFTNFINLCLLFFSNVL